MSRVYTDYVPTKIEWLSAIPKHWLLKRLKFISKIQFSGVDKNFKEDEIEVQLCNYVDVYKNEIIDNSIDFMKASATKREIKKFQLKAGDILVTKDSESPYDIAVPAIISEDYEDVLCGYHLAQIKPNKQILLPRYLFRLFQEKGFNSQFIVKANGITRFGVGTDVFGSAIVPLPSYEEQIRIATFLDHKTSQIDKLIAEKEKLLKLLEEKRIALITKAVTKGLNPDVKMKPSGVDWLGDIPEHWQARKLKYGLSGGLKYGANEEAEFDNPLWPRYIRITDFNNEGELYDDTFRSLPEEIAEPYLLKDKDILLARSGATVGKSFLYRSKFGRSAYAGYLIRARTNIHLSSDYLYNFLQSQSYWDWIKSSLIQATIQNVSGEKYANLIIPFPPSAEQVQITNKLNESTIQIKRLVENIQIAIEKLKEYRSSLITSAVTGKIDVRNYKPEEEHEEIH